MTNSRQSGGIQQSNTAISHTRCRECNTSQSFRSPFHTSGTMGSSQQSQSHNWIPHGNLHHHPHQQHQQQQPLQHDSNQQHPSPSSNFHPATSGSGSRSGSQAKGRNHRQNHQHSPTSFVLHKLSSFSRRKSESDRRKVAERELDSLNSKIVSLLSCLRRHEISM